MVNYLILNKPKFYLIFLLNNHIWIQYKKYNADFSFSNSYFHDKSLYLPT